MTPKGDINQVIIAYVPSIHTGYVKFFDKYPDASVLILSTELVREVPRLDRDMRALSADDACSMIKAIYPNRSVDVLSKNNIDTLITPATKIIMPDEDVSHEFVKGYLDINNINFVNTFLRWDRPITIKESEVPAGRVVSKDTFDSEVIQQTKEVAQKSPDWWRQVGAAIVKDKKVSYLGYNKHLPSNEYDVNTFGDPRSNFDAGEYIELSKAIHAEASLIAAAAKQGTKLEGADIYVSVFPCPVCARLISAAGIAKVYYQDGYSLMDAEDILKSASVEIILVKD